MEACPGMVVVGEASQVDSNSFHVDFLGCTVVFRYVAAAEGHMAEVLEDPRRIGLVGLEAEE